jgi:hypothetical protein
MAGDSYVRMRKPDCTLSLTNFDSILHHCARVRKQKTLRILRFVLLRLLTVVIRIEDHHKLTQTQFLIQSPLGNLTFVLTNLVPRACDPREGT